MNRFADPISRLIDELRKLPGIGTKSAQRIAFHLLRGTDDDARALADSILVLREKLRLCSICNNITDVDPCIYCTSPHPRPAHRLRPRRAHQHRHHREDAQLQRRLPRPPRHALAHRRRRPGATPHRQPPHPPRARRVSRRRNGLHKFTRRRIHPLRKFE